MLSALIDSRSRWLVGSSSTSTLGFCSISLQNSRRAASPPERTPVFLVASSRAKSIWPRISAQFLGNGCAVPLMEPLENRRSALDQTAMVLREVADRSLVSPDYFPGVNQRTVIAAGLA